MRTQAPQTHPGEFVGESGGAAERSLVVTSVSLGHSAGAVTVGSAVKYIGWPGVGWMPNTAPGSHSSRAVVLRR